MKRRLKHKGKGEEPGKPLTLSQCRQQMLTALVFTALFAVFLSVSFATHQHRSRYSVLTICFWGMFWAMRLLQSWKQYRLIKQGGTVYVTSPKPLPLPNLVSVPFVSILTLFVAAIDAMAIFIAGVRVHTLEAWAIAGTVCVPLTLYIAYCWYRIGGKRQARAAALYRQGEGVWPPAPCAETTESPVTAYHKTGSSKYIKGGFTHGDYVELGPRRRSAGAAKSKCKGIQS